MLSMPPAEPDTPPPPRPAFQIGALLRINASRPRGPIALRAALCMGMAITAGLIAGDMRAGLLATLGVFTTLYASDRPYLNRAVILAGVALALALAAMAGVATQDHRWLAVPVVATIAAVATFLFNAIKIGPPGSYMIALSCAAGTAMPTADLRIWQIGGLVLAGGALAWAAQMTGALFGPRRPEQAAVAFAAAATARFAEVTDTAREYPARQAAALALHDAWAALVTFQPARARPGRLLTGLRAMNRELHLLFAARVNAVASDELRASAAGRARDIGAAALSTSQDHDHAALNHMPFGHFGMAEAILENLRFWSPAALAATRVGIATMLAGAIGAMLGLERSYWAMAAAVLVLYQGLDLMRAVQRGVERMIGTLLGLCLAGMFFAIHPSAIWLVALMMVFQFLAEMLVMRNYPLAVVFITSAALAVASNGYTAPHPFHLLWARGVDTIIGCVVALIVRAATANRVPAAPLRGEMLQVLTAIQPVLGGVVTERVTTDAMRRMRRKLQQCLFVLAAAYEMEIGGLSRRRAAVGTLWPMVAATQRLGYRVLAACWRMEETGSILLPAATLAQVKADLAGIIGAVEAPDPSLPPADLYARIESVASAFAGEM